MCLLFWLVLAIEVPQPASQWTVSYQPEMALVKSTGESVLVKNGDFFLYDPEGNLVETFRIDFTPAQVFSGPGDSIWVHDGNQLLGRLNASHRLAWQRQIAPPEVPTRVFGEFLIYCEGNNLRLIDPEDGRVRASLERALPIATVTVHGEELLISERDGDVLGWDPFSGSKRWIYRSGPTVRFLAMNPIGALMLVHRGGILRALKPNGKVHWKREYHIEIGADPIWLNIDDKPQWVVGTLGRVVYAYGAKGNQLAKIQVKSRPKHLLAWSQTLGLIIPSLSGQLVWYDGAQKRFIPQDLGEFQTLVAINGPHLLMVGNDGIIRRYRRETER